MRSNNNRHLQTGEWGEALAGRMLRKKGYRILGKRVRVGTRDEIDLVARCKGILVFLEVKTRKRESFGRPAAAVGRNKRRVMSRAAVRYLKRLGCPRTCFRFDVVEVVGSIGDRNPVIRHIENVFPLDKRYMLPY